MTEHMYDAFFAPHDGLPRQSPGSDSTTRRLLSLAGPLPPRPRVLDLGRGPGRASLLLAAEAGAEVTAVDLHQPFLDELAKAAEARGLGERIRTVRAGMTDLTEPEFADGSFDLVWAEGSACVIGFDTAVRDWRRLLAPGGSMVVTECVRTTDAPSAGARAFQERRAALRSSVAENTAAAVEAGCHVVGVLTRPGSDWVECGVPPAGRADPSAPGMPEALSAAHEELEVRRHGAEYGFAGYALRPFDARWRTRPETAADREAVHDVVAAAFPTREEAGLVEALRTDPGAWLPGLSYVAEAPDGSVAAHALLTRCRVGDAPALALAPVATAPGHQRGGAGRAVVRAVLDSARLRGESLVLVLGHPEYYPVFGFVPASRFGIRPGFEVPDEAMMALILDDSVPVPQGMIHYPAAFGV
ncbi:GNAT family N-acetyltransferase [Streptomyces sp. NPDC102402]|uniref:GNAT family N-acetyltransferase n=1 Tax=Streptomyces sp. NPDC102402 TaxID=3366169 RepID=UPI0038113DBB